eukprot:1283177-Rhodomonas_salina.1
MKKLGFDLCVAASSTLRAKRQPSSSPFSKSSNCGTLSAAPCEIRLEKPQSQHALYHGLALDFGLDLSEPQYCSCCTCICHSYALSGADHAYDATAPKSRSPTNLRISESGYQKTPIALRTR